MVARCISASRAIPSRERVVTGTTAVDDGLAREVGVREVDGNDDAGSSAIVCTTPPMDILRADALSAVRLVALFGTGGGAG